MKKDIIKSNEATVYKLFIKPAGCEYLGQKKNRELAIIAFAQGKGDRCTGKSEMTSNGTREVLGNTLSVSKVVGKHGDTLFLETTKVNGGVALGFFYKQKYANRVRPEIKQVLESYRIN